MNVEQTVQFLTTIGAKGINTHKRTGWVICKCPLGPWRHEHGESSPEVFGIKLEPGDAQVHCFSCDYHGKMSDLVLEMSHLNKLSQHVTVKWGELLQVIDAAEHEVVLPFNGPTLEELLYGDKPQPHIFPDWWLDSFIPWREVFWARAYLSKRNVPAWVADDLDLRVDTGEQRICFPVRDFEQQLRGLHGRAVHKETEPRYRMYTFQKKNNPEIWLGESWIDTTLPMVVVEGPFDVAAVKRVYPNVGSPLFSNPNAEKLKRMGDVYEWITLYDTGTGGDRGRIKVTKVMGDGHLITHLKPPPGYKDPGEMTAAALRELLGKIVHLSH